MIAPHLLPKRIRMVTQEPEHPIGILEQPYDSETNRSVGHVETRYYQFALSPNELTLESGERLGPITVAYETYGELNADRSNALLPSPARDEETLRNILKRGSKPSGSVWKYGMKNFIKGFVRGNRKIPATTDLCIRYRPPSRFLGRGTYMVSL
jgi:hypothetical protein